MSLEQIGSALSIALNDRARRLARSVMLGVSAFWRIVWNGRVSRTAHELASLCN
jgi:hypothetical protein